MYHTAASMANVLYSPRPHVDLLVDTSKTLARELNRASTNHCYACGPGNARGLHLRFDMDDEGVVRTTFTAEDWQAGWENVIHGGIVATLLDESMAYTLHFNGWKAVTARMEVRFRLPVRNGDQLDLEARIVSESRRIADIEARAMRAGVVVAESSGRFMKLGRLEDDTGDAVFRVDTPA